MRTCSKCNQTKELNLFPKDKNSKQGTRRECKVCHAKNYHDNKERWNTVEKRKVFRQQNLEKCRKQGSDWYRNNKQAHKNSRLKRTYGITLDQYNQMIKDQNGQCAICKTDKPDGLGKQFNVDHCHKTGKVRELLCFSCNAFIGYSKENIESLKSAITYLTKHSF